MYNFAFGGIWLSEFGALSTETPDIEIAQRDGDLVSVPGKSGDVFVDKGRYKNVPISRGISMIGKPGFSVEDKTADLIDAFAYLQGYQSFEDTDHNDLITEAVLENFQEVNKKLRILHETTLKFSRKPFWYLKSGLEFQSVDLNPSTPTMSFNNPYKLDAAPIFVFEIASATSGTIKYTITNNGTTTTNQIPAGAFSENFTVTIDCEKQTIKSSLSSFLNINVPKGFGLGENVFSITENKSRLVSVKIAPRWRCL